MIALVMFFRSRFADAGLLCRGLGVPRTGDPGALNVRSLLSGRGGGESRSPDWCDEADTKLSSVDIVSVLSGLLAMKGSLLVGLSLLTNRVEVASGLTRLLPRGLGGVGARFSTASLAELEAASLTGDGCTTCRAGLTGRVGFGDRTSGVDVLITLGWGVSGAGCDFGFGRGDEDGFGAAGMTTGRPALVSACKGFDGGTCGLGFGLEGSDG